MREPNWTQIVVPAFYKEFRQLFLANGLDTPKGIRTMLVQKAIKGSPASDEEITEFFREKQWRPFTSNGETAWFDDQRNIIVSDTHKGNLIKTEDGTLVPIDFRIQSVSGAILDAVKRLV